MYGVLLLIILTSCTNGDQMAKEKEDNMTHFVTKENGTEEPFNNEYWDEHRAGIYTDINTGEPLFSSLDKFDSNTGWPAFSRTINEALVQTKEDNTLGMIRTEVRTKDSHLGHVFDDGPNDGPRFCINSAALNFVPYENLEKEGLSEYKELFDFEETLLAGGCFWGVEFLLQKTDGRDGCFCSPRKRRRSTFRM